MKKINLIITALIAICFNTLSAQVPDEDKKPALVFVENGTPAYAV